MGSSPTQGAIFKGALMKEHKFTLRYVFNNEHQFGRVLKQTNTLPQLVRALRSEDKKRTKPNGWSYIIEVPNKNVIPAVGTSLKNHWGCITDCIVSQLGESCLMISRQGYDTLYHFRVKK